jgi:glycosyltransferase involved in cell wall biosynthesis
MTVQSKPGYPVGHSSPLDLVVVTRDPPSRSNFGGMREVVTRYEHAVAVGHRVHVVSFASAGETGAGEIILGRRGIGHAARMALTDAAPLQIGLRDPESLALDRAIARLHARHLRPRSTVVLAEQFVTLPVAARVATALGAPLVHRTQNDEHAYARYVAACERRPAQHVVLRAEARLINRCVRRWTADQRIALLVHISPDSQAAWRRAARWPLAADDMVIAPTLPACPVAPARLDEPFRVVYVGSVDLAQNAAEVRRFLHESWLPFRRSGLDDASSAIFRLAGRGAAAFAAATDAALLDGVEVVSDFDAAADVLAGCDVALNPAIGGSGVSIKTIEYLAHGLPVVTEAAGFRGIDVPPSVQAVSTSLYDGLVAASADRRRLHARRGALAEWYGATLAPDAILPPLWDRLREVAAASSEVGS